MKRLSLIGIVAAFLVVAGGSRAESFALTPAQVTAHKVAVEQSQFTPKHKLPNVTCKADTPRHIYTCSISFPGKGCVETYIHYNPATEKQANYNQAAWPCGTKAPFAPPPFPGDGNGLVGPTA